MKRIFILLVAAIVPMIAFAQNLVTAEPLKLVEGSQADVLYANEFGNFRNDELDEPFPYCVIRIDLEGDVEKAKSMLSLDVGSMFKVEDKNVFKDNMILFLIRSSVRQVYLQCGDGCKPQQLHYGTLQANKVYACKVTFKAGGQGGVSDEDMESFKKQNEQIQKQNEQMQKQMAQMQKQNEQMQQLLLSMQQNQNSTQPQQNTTPNNTPSQSIIEVAKGITINLNNPEDARFYAMSGSELYNYGLKCEGATEARVFAIGAYKWDLDCQRGLGYCYAFGRGVSQDYYEAVKWYRKAAEQGNGKAQCNLGYCYESGQGVSKDVSEAVKWYRKAAEQGLSRAQFNLGLCYEWGKGVSKDISEAVKWYRKAAEQEYSDAQCNLGYCYESGQGVSKDISEAVKWYRKAAEQGYSTAQCNLGYCYYNGQGVTQDYYEAVKWYRKAAEQGNIYAQYNLGYCYENGQGVSKDISEAVKWYRKAANQGYENAKNALTRLGY